MAVLAAYGYLSSAHNASVQQRLLERQAAENAIVARARGAAEHGDVAKLGPLLDKNGTLLRRRVDLVECAARFGQTEAVRLLLDHGWPCDGIGHSGEPLLQAACGGRSQVVKLLVARGASVNVMRGGATPLISAVGQNDVGTVALLLKAGADINARVPRAPAAILPADPHWLIGDQPGGAAKTAPPTARTHKSETVPPRLANMHLATALMGAARAGYRAMVELLLARGADPTIRSDDGLTAADVARVSRHEGVYRILKRAEQARR